jgi:uncharacterized protein
VCSLAGGSFVYHQEVGMSETGVRGRFVWYELMTKDPKAAQEFYKEVVGWGTAPFEGAGRPYTMWMRGEAPLGGVVDLPEEARKAGAPPHWLAYVGTPDTDATAREVEAKGGKVLVPPMDIPTVGRFAVLADPQGAVFAAFKPAQEPAAAEASPRLGDISWHELATTDPEAAFSFYAALFGWKKTEAMDMGPMGTYQMYGRPGGPTLGGIFKKPAEMPAPPHWLLYAMVDDVHRVIEVVKKRGGQVLNGPMEVPGGGWIAQCLDPQGAAFALHHDKKE